jgi:hypothetical protein
MLIRYLRNLSAGRLILWCYFIWYCVVLLRYFDASLRLWLTSLGLSLIIGFALVISTRAGVADGVRLGFWSTFRLFLMPFCVSSFAALVKGKGFFLVFSPKPLEIGVAAGLCLLLWGIVTVAKRSGAKAGLPESAEPSQTRQ